MKCTICDREIDIPDGSIEIRRSHGRAIYRFPNGDIHAFRVLHQKADKPATVQVVTEPPKEETELQTVEVLAEFPEPEPEVIAEEATTSMAADKPFESLTLMALAFRRSKEIKKKAAKFVFKGNTK